MKFIMPVILILIAISGFFLFANPLLSSISELNAKAAAYNDALGNSKMLENERDKLTAKYNSIDPENLKKLQKFLPENVDNIRLILEIEQIAAPYGMALSNVKYNTPEQKPAAGGAQTGVFQGGAGKTASSDFGIFDLEFSTIGKYNNFLNFTRDLENNLRMVDISSISFSSTPAGVLGDKVQASDVYKYDFTIKTYWLKN
jgi:Tfp pilus assembly protein PilO